jgi:3-oxoacyl-[acyl-carrier-protein] synthase I
LAESSFLPLCILGAGVCCSLGHSLPAVHAAIRARLNHFQQTFFVRDGGKAIVGAPVHGLPFWGAERQAAMLTLAVEEAWQDGQAQGSLDPGATALLLLLPEPTQSATPLNELREGFESLVASIGLHAASRAMQPGSGGVAQGLRIAAGLLQTRAIQPQVQHVLFAAVDSLLSAPRIEQLLAERRLAHDGHTDALTPAEGAACVLLSPQGHVQRDTVWITSAAHAEDPWRLDGEEPMRAIGLTQAMRAAAAGAELQISDMAFHANGANGEHWYSREVEMALSRAMERRSESFAQHTMAQFLGDTGASLPVLTLAWASKAMCRTRNAIGRAGLLHFAGLDGQRSAMVLERQPAPPDVPQGETMPGF